MLKIATCIRLLAYVGKPVFASVSVGAHVYESVVMALYVLVLMLWRLFLLTCVRPCRTYVFESSSVSVSSNVAVFVFSRF